MGMLDDDAAYGLNPEFAVLLLIPMPIPKAFAPLFVAPHTATADTCSSLRPRNTLNWLLPLLLAWRNVADV